MHIVAVGVIIGSWRCLLVVVARSWCRVEIGIGIIGAVLILVSLDISLLLPDRRLLMLMLIFRMSRRWRLLIVPSPSSQAAANDDNTNSNKNDASNGDACNLS